MIDVHCPDSPTGRHVLFVHSAGYDGEIGVSCRHCDWSVADSATYEADGWNVAGGDFVDRMLNAAMMLTADEAERYDSDEQLGNYARTWRGEQ